MTAFTYLKAATWIFLLGAGSRLLHAWYTFFECGAIWPAGGIKDYLINANPQQFMINLHVSFCSIWACILFYQFYNKLYATNTSIVAANDKNNTLSSHAKWGYLGAFIATIAVISGWSSVWTLRLPTHVAFCIKTQLLIGAPVFYLEVIQGIIAITKFKDYKRHKQHMLLALIGTFADAGNGFSVYVSRKLFEGTPYQQWAQDVGVLSLNIISIVPFLMPGIGPNIDHLLYKTNFKALKDSFFKNCTYYDSQALSTIIVGPMLMMVHIIGLAYLYSIRPWQEYRIH